MKNRIKIFGLILILAIAFSNAFGQGDEFFASGEGGFSINLPKNFTSSKNVAFVEQGMNVVGKEYIWEKENQFFYQIEYIEFQIEKKSLTAAQKKAALDSFRDGLIQAASRFNNPYSEKPFSYGAHPGREFQINYPYSKVIYRFFIANKILYVMGTMIFNLRDEAQSRLILDSFRLLNKQEIIARKVTEATPEALPQSPVVPKLKSDAEDEGLKGKVKSVVEASLEWKQRNFPNKRKTQSETIYDERGNKIKHTDFSNNVPFDIDVYGYLDDMRVSRNGFVYTEESGVIRASTVAGAVSAPKPSDKRYGVRYEYKYENGFLQEESVYLNNGDLSHRKVYKRSGNKVEQLFYDQDGKVTGTYANLLGDKGNITEEISYDQTGKIDYRYSYKYEDFDAQGNWTRRRVSEWKNRAFIPNSIEYRTIIYYP